MTACNAGKCRVSDLNQTLQATFGHQLPYFREASTESREVVLRIVRCEYE